MKSSHCSKILLFDFGCILVGLSKERCIKALEQIGCGKIAYYVDECKQEDLFHDLEVGGSIEAFCAEARRQSSFTDEMGVFRECEASDNDICWAWNELLTGIPAEKLRRIKSLKDAGYRTAVLSNTNEIHWQKAIRDFFTIDGMTVDDYFDDIFLSCDMGLVKPDADIYRKVIEGLQCQPGDVLFIDDSAKNCAAAEALGINTLHDAKGTLWLEQLKAPYAAIIGNFDGVHKGHQHVVESLKTEARKRQLAPLAITFDRHPRTLFDKEFTPKFLSTQSEKTGMLGRMGCENAVLPFTKELASITARDFIRLIRDEMGVKLLLLGYDNRFGKRNASETFDDYKRYGEELGVEVLLADAMDVEGVRVSSSYVRHIIAEGNMTAATACLGRNYAVTGIVMKGFQEGRKIGFPTANIAVAQEKLLPANGVYRSRTLLADGWHASVTNIGMRPTYNGSALSVETHIPGFAGDLYGQEITVEIEEKLRSEQPFDSPEELRQQIEKDIEHALNS